MRNATSWIESKTKAGASDYPIAKWISRLLLVASLTMLIFNVYRGEIYWRGEQNDFFIKYYVIFLVSTLFWAGVIWLGNGIQAKIVTVVVSIIFSLYLVEFVLIFLGIGQPLSDMYVARAAKQGIEFDQRDKLTVIEDLIAEGVDAVPTFHPRGYLLRIDIQEDNGEILLPLGGVSRKVTVYNNESGEFTIYKSDRHGFNNPDNEWDSKAQEWMTVGDSFAQGSGVKPGEEIAGQLRSITNSTVVNLGIGGNGPLLELASLIEFGKFLKPRKVLWVYYEGNDLVTNLRTEKESPLLMKYMQDGFSQHLIKRQEEVDKLLNEHLSKEKEKEKEKAKAKAKRDKWIHRKRWIRLRSVRSVIGINTKGDIDVDPLFEKILTKAKAEVEAWGGFLYFVYLPEYACYSSSISSHGVFRKKAEVINIANRLDIPVVDIHREVFEKHSDPLALFPFRLFGHYNAEGNAEVAKAIVRIVQD